MKSKIISIFLLAIFSCVSIASNADDIHSTERDIKKVQKEISQLASQKKTTETKLQKAETDFQEATAKMKETEDKPKSLPYKNAAKKAETSQQIIEELRLSLQSIESELKSKNDELSNYQQILLAAQQTQEDESIAKDQVQEDEKTTKLQARKDAKIAKQREKDSIKLAKQQKKDSIKLAKQQDNNVIGNGHMENPQRQATYDGMKQPICDPSESKEKTSFSEIWDNADRLTKIVSILCYVLLPILIMWGIWRGFKRRNHCPECGKWFTMQFVRGHRTRDANQEMVFRSVRRCSNCGYEATFFEPVKK